MARDWNAFTPCAPRPAGLRASLALVKSVPRPGCLHGIRGVPGGLLAQVRAA